MNATNEIDAADPSDPIDPFALFDTWLKQAQQQEPNDPAAAALATATANGHPSVRMVLIKPTGPHRFTFFTNAESRKGLELDENPRAALCFHWKSLRRQVRVEGTISTLESAATDRYFHSRPRASQISAAVSDQSRPLASREALEARFQTFAAAHPNEIPRPAYWQGFYINPEKIEFWINGPDRLHDRFLFTKISQTSSNDQWRKSRLYP